MGRYMTRKIPPLHYYHRIIIPILTQGFINENRNCLKQKLKYICGVVASWSMSATAKKGQQLNLIIHRSAVTQMILSSCWWHTSPAPPGDQTQQLADAPTQKCDML